MLRQNSPRDVELLKAARIGDERTLRELLGKKGVNPNAQDENGMTPLHLAVRKGFPKLVVLLLRKRATVPDQSDKYGFTPLHWASFKGDVACVKLLLQLDVSLTGLDDDSGFSPLHWAVNKQQRAVIPLLAEAGADLNMTCAKGLTPLQWACRNGHLRIVQTLLNCGALPSHTDEWGVAPLHLAAMRGKTPIVEALIAAGAEVDLAANNRTTALHQAAGEGHADVVGVLLAAGASAAVENVDGNTPFHFAAKGGFVPICVALVARGVDVNKLNSEGVGALHFAAYHGHAALVGELVGTMQCDASLMNRNGSTPLHLAAHAGHKSVCQVLATSGANLDAFNIDGNTALHYASKAAHDDVSIFLINAGAQVDVANSEGESPLAFYLRRDGTDEMIRFLREKGATDNPQRLHEPARTAPVLPDGSSAAATGDDGGEGTSAGNGRETGKKKKKQKNRSALPDMSWEIGYPELEFDQVIGKGSYGEVWRGAWRGTGVAIKSFSVRAMNAKNRALFQAEVDVMARLRHPNVVLFMGACTQGPDPLCIITEFVEGGSLFHALHNKRRSLTFELALGVAYDIACGMNYLHCCDPIIMHRDLKTLNVLVDVDWRNAKVCDFGLVKIKQQAWAHTRCGTPHYMAPQVLTRDDYDEKADVYAFGIILWELFTRREPYRELKAKEVGRRVLAGMRPQIPRDCPRRYAALMQQCWDEESDPRPPFDQIIQILQSMQKKKGKGKKKGR